MHFPKMPEGLSHKLAIGAAVIFVVGGTLLYINKNGSEELGISPGTMNTGLGGFGDLVKRLLGNSDSAKKDFNLNLPLPPTGQIGPDLPTDINSQPAPSDGATSSFIEQFKQQLTDFFMPLAAPAADNNSPTANIPTYESNNIYNGSSYATETPTIDNGLVLPAGSNLQGAGIITQAEILTPIPGGTGNLAQDSYGNIYQTSLPPTSGPGTEYASWNPNPGTPVGGTWNPGMGHDPGNQYDTN